MTSIKLIACPRSGWSWVFSGPAVTAPAPRPASPPGGEQARVRMGAPSPLARHLGGGVPADVSHTPLPHQQGWDADQLKTDRRHEVRVWTARFPP